MFRKVSKRPLRNTIASAYLSLLLLIVTNNLSRQLQPDDKSISKEWEEKLNEARKRFKENSAIVVSTKEKENDDCVSVNEDEYFRVS